MYKILFATDLDGTLISTDNAPEGTQNIVVASVHGTRIFMTNKNLSLLKELSRVADILPVTTRCQKSYNKIGLCIPIKSALIENGAMLLTGNKIDMAWKYKSYDIIDKDKDIVEKGHEYLINAGYKKKSDAEFTIDYITDEHDMEKNTAHCELLTNIIGEKFDVVKNGDNAIYATAKSLNKKKTLERYLESNSYNLVICAGDTNGDWDMLSMTDKSIGLSNSVAAVKFPIEEYHKNQHLFAEFVLTKALEIAKKYC